MYRDGYDAIVKAMKGKRVHLFDLMPIVNEVFDKADCYPYDLFIYSILGEMRRNGLLVLETEKLPATVPNVFGKKTYLRYIG